MAETGLSGLVEIRAGDALQTLRDSGGTIDLLFLDCWPEYYLDIFRLASSNLRQGSVILAENLNIFPDQLAPYLSYIRNPADGFISVTYHSMTGLSILSNFDECPRCSITSHCMGDNFTVFKTMKHDALIIGATRETGKQITTLLLEKGHKPLVVARNLDKARALFSAEAEVLYGDVTQSLTLEQALIKAVSLIIYTVDITGGIGGRGILASRQKIRSVVLGGVANTIDVAKRCGWQGQFILLTTLGLNQSSLIMRTLELIKPGVLQASRDKAARLIDSGFTYTIVQAGALHDKTDSGQALVISPGDIKMTLARKVSRLHLAQVMLECIGNPSTYHKIFNVYGGQGDRLDGRSIAAQLSQLT